jgi:hydroxyethylthiazole kinase-like uncharacterized protein yjeF
MKNKRPTIINSADTKSVRELLSRLYQPAENAHKGQNGKVLVIGGSELFHSSLIWAATIASKVVDMVHVASPAKTNEALVRERIKKEFLEGIVIPWNRVEEYIEEDDVILIGPGMPRDEGLEAGEESTGMMVDRLVAAYPDKKWVIDGGALQAINPELIKQNMIITPHAREFARLEGYLPLQAVIVLKGPVDKITSGQEMVMVEGGNPGMTKGGTGDVLAGLTAALYTKNEAMTAATAASVVCKRAGDELKKRQGLYFNASDLTDQIPQTMRRLIGEVG